MIKRTLLLIILALMTAPALAMPTRGTTINRRFDRHFVYFLERWHVPGATVAVMKHGKLLMAKGYGYADLARKTPMKPDNLFRIGSISKLITAVATLKLVQEKRLKLTNKVFNVLDDMTPLGQIKPNRRLHRITVRNLLQMSSGWYTHRPQDLDPMFGPWPSHIKTKLNWEVPPTCKSATRLMMARHLGYHPGQQFSYSNLNYCMLGLIIEERLSHYIEAPSTYARFIKRDILRPIGIYDMFIGDTQHILTDPDEATYYSYPPEEDDPNIGNNDGLPYSTTEILKKNAADAGWVGSSIDLVKFMDALGRRKIINNTMIRTLIHRPIFQRNPRHYFSMGMVVQKIGQRWYWIKTGSFTGTLALVIHRSDGKVFAALLNTEPALKWRCFKQLQALLLTL